MREFWQDAIQRAADEIEPTTRPLFERLKATPPARTRYGDNGH